MGKKSKVKQTKKSKTLSKSLVSSFKDQHSLLLNNCSNVVPESCPGCFCWNGVIDSDWLLGKPERFRRSDFGLSKLDKVPDLSVDPDNKVLTVINSAVTPKCYHITVEHPVIGRNGPLFNGTARSENNSEIKCVAFVLLLPPETMVEVCQIEVDGNDVRISSDIVDWVPHPSPTNHGVSFDWFPLSGKKDQTFLCSQGCGGGLTHFSHPSTFHALDFQTPVGTPVLAVGDGIITDIRQKCCVSGIHVSNLFQWNSIALELDPKNDYEASGAAEEPEESCIIVEYVHIKAHSVKVAVGDRVKAGQLLCLSGDAGFCPVAHLHIEAHRSKEPGAPSVPMSWRQKDGGCFAPVAGQFYDPKLCKYSLDRCEEITSEMQGVELGNSVLEANIAPPQPPLSS